MIVPTGWKVATALRPSGQTGNRIDYAVTSYEILMDFPLIAGVHYRAFPLSPDVTLDVIADNEAELAAKPEQIEAHKRLVQQAVKAFGAQHYDHYDFLLTISDYLGGNGLEHHRSSEDGTGPDISPSGTARVDRNLLPHEFSHSAGTASFAAPPTCGPRTIELPMQDSLLWVYEGQTEYWGYVLGARSGMLSKQDTLDEHRRHCGLLPAEGTAGRDWRPLLDTTNDPIVASRQPNRGVVGSAVEDYYSEGQLIWMDVDR